MVALLTAAVFLGLAVLYAVADEYLLLLAPIVIVGWGAVMLWELRG